MIALSQIPQNGLDKLLEYNQIQSPATYRCRSELGGGFLMCIPIVKWVYKGLKLALSSGEHEIT